MKLRFLKEFKFPNKKQTLNFDHDNFRYKIFNADTDSDFINAIYTRVINSLSEEVFQINLASLYDETMIFQNRNKISEEIYQQVLSFQNEFITNCKNKINSKLLSEYLKNFNYYLDCDAVISYYQKSITEQFFGLLIHIEMIIYRDKIENSKELKLINDYSKYVRDNLNKIIQDYIESIAYNGRFYFSTIHFYEKMKILRINELNQKEGLTEEEFLKIHKEETESLHFQKSLMKSEFPKILKENLFDLEIKYKKIAQNLKENTKLINQCHDSLVSLGLIKRNRNQFYNFIRNRSGRINWLKNKNELLFFVHIINETLNITEIKDIYIWMCDHFTFKGQEIKHNPNLGNEYYKYQKNPPKKNRQKLILKIVKELDNLKWNYKTIQ
ncbi:hypothetical protein [Labilibaculum manganireducens]|uniref:hypothetical protein n=1 Tax=Labilibaculum manganireducens TaxID=1940525 RepID=UPI0029F4EB22|nr:hypothetical protein [Labilibaculum manganireducens]